MLLKTKGLLRMLTCGISTTHRVMQQTPNLPRSLVKLRWLQDKFQRDDGKPVWLKMGMMDRILYTTTIVLCWLGLIMAFDTVYELAKPASWRTTRTC